MSTESPNPSIVPRSVSRRTLLALLTGTAAAGTGAFFLTRSRDALYPWEQEALERLGQRLALHDEVDVLGRAAIEALGEARPGALAERLFRGPDRFRDQDGEHMLEQLREAMRADYASGRTLAVDDWELSQTEARLFAVLHATRRRSTA